uniref:BED-type domain-containing protein n=1 Tax=Noccaea caerulescens TaxID=107243 RepID=A0A1J3HT39_NOCCA
MVREKDICWEYAEKLDGNKVRCKFCSRILNGGISRLKHHLSRLPSKGVNPCAKVRDDVTDRVRSILSAKDDAKESPPVTYKTPPPPPETKPLSAPLEAVSSASRLFPSILLPAPSCPNPNAQEIAERSISLFFFENKVDFGVARSSSYHQMVDAIAKCGPGFVAPSAPSLKTEWLDSLKSEITLQLKEVEKEWSTTGCTVVAEAWTDNKSRALINFFVSSPSRTSFHKSVDASSYFKNTKSLADLFDSMIQDIGQEHIVQIIMDNNFSYTGISNHILQNYASIFVSPCASQCLNMILEEFSKVDWVNQCILQAQVITRFVYNNSSVLDLMKKVTGGQDIIRSGVSRSVSSFLSLQAMMKQKARLKQMFNSPEYSLSTHANKPQSMSCVGILEDNDFWRAVEESVAISEPILKVLREVSGGKPAVGSIYELMWRAKESIRTYYIMDENKHKVFSDIVDTKWCDHLHSPLHAAAAFLNPSIQYNPEIKFLTSLKENFFKVLEKLLPTSDLRRDITNQIFTFTRAKGMFGCNLAMEARETVSPGLWWEQFGDSAPVLQRVAIRILSQVCSGYSLERQWSTFQQIQWERRNKIEREMLNNLAYVNQNLKLGRVITLETDPIALEDIDMMSEWVEEAENPSPAQWLDRFGSALDSGGDLNTRQFGGAIFGATDHNIFGL